MEHKDYEELRRLMSLAKSQHDGSGYSVLDEALESIGQRPLVPSSKQRVYAGAKVKAMPKAAASSSGGMSDAAKRRMIDEPGWGLVDEFGEDISYAAVGDMTAHEAAAYMEAHNVPVPYADDISYEPPQVDHWYPELDYANVDTKVPIPLRWKSSQEWGRVIITMPKYAGKGETFESLLRGAYGGNVDKITYCTFIVGKYAARYTPEPSTQGADFAGFLMHMRYKAPVLKARGYNPTLAPA